MKEDSYINVNLKDMFEDLIDCIIHSKRPTSYYYKRLNFYTEEPEFILITEVDILDSRFRTVDGDFSEFEWELDKSSIYKMKGDSLC